MTLRPDQSPVEDQGPHRATCVSFCVDACLEFLTNTDLSEQYTYWLARSLAVTGQGLPLTSVAGLVAAKGTLAEQFWPYDPDQIGRAPPQATLTAPRIKFKGVRRIDPREPAGFRQCLDARLPVMCGVRVYADSGWEDGDISLPTSAALASWRDVRIGTGTRVADGWHAILIVGYDADEGLFEFKNSWGDGWGDRGYGWLSARYLERHCAEACVAWI